MDYIIMSKDNIVAKWINNNLEIVNNALLPIYLKNTGDFEGWLESRAIDAHRANSRLIKKAIRLKNRDDISTVLSVNAVTITDTYWVKEIDSTLVYADVVFDKEKFAALALKGSYSSFNYAAKSKDKKTPELTNIGSFEKCWKLKNGEWWMYKKANHNELFSELFTYMLGKKLGMNMAVYEKGKGFIQTKDFTGAGELSFEPAYSFIGDNEDYIDNYKRFSEISTEIGRDYFNIIYLDTLVANPDRHTFNYGILRNSNTGEIVEFAPNFDNNMALIARGYPTNTKRKNDVLVSSLNKLINYEPKLKKYIKPVSEDMLYNILKELNMKVKSAAIVEFIINGYSQILK